MKIPTFIRLRLVLAAAAAGALAAALMPLLPGIVRGAGSVMAVKHSRRSALEVLGSEQLGFLVTDRIVSRIVVESDDSSPVLGKKEGYLIAGATLYYGIDLAKLTEADLVREGGCLTVRLPAPEALDFSVDPGSMRFLSKRSGLMAIADWIGNADQEQELRLQLRAAALEHMRDGSLIPSKEDIVRRLAAVSPMLAEYIGVEEVVFR